MNRKRTSTDGFILRRRQTQQTAGSGRRQIGVDNLDVPQQFLDEKKLRSDSALNKHTKKSVGTGINRRDIDDSLKDIDLNEPNKKKKRHFKPSKKAVKRTFIALFIILALVGGYLGIKALIASGRLFGGNLFDLFGQGQPLKTDQFGRSNIVLFGTSEDDEGHPGASLTDSILVISLDQKKNNAFMFSVPRDLYVDYGSACNSGYEGRINEVYACARGDDTTDDKAERRGQQALQKVVGEVYGMDVQYATKVNYKVVRESVDAIGGVSVTINSRDPRGVLDRNFDWRCNYDCYKVRYPNGRHHLNGEQALFLAQSRGESAPTYGFEESNFDRERNQRKIITAMLKKANSSSTLANPVKMSNLIDALGDNVRTNFVAGEIKTLTRLARNIKADTIQNLDFFKEGEALFTTENMGGMSVVVPVAGTFDYSDIHAFIRSYQISDEVAKEKASVEVLNGSGVPGAAQKEADKVESAGITVSNIGNAPTGNYGSLSVYYANGNKPATKKKLRKTLGVNKVRSLPSNIQSSANFVVVVGQ